VIMTIVTAEEPEYLITKSSYPGEAGRRHMGSARSFRSPLLGLPPCRAVICVLVRDPEVLLEMIFVQAI
jgi:hypothetical protein